MTDHLIILCCLTIPINKSSYSISFSKRTQLKITFPCAQYVQNIPRAAAKTFQFEVSSPRNRDTLTCTITQETCTITQQTCTITQETCTLTQETCTITQ